MSQNPRLLAEADQIVAETNTGLDALIEAARGRLDEGMDRTVTIGLVVVALRLQAVEPVGLDELLRGMAVAVVRLAEGGAS